MAAISQERVIMEIHRALGHPHEMSRRATAKRYGIVLPGKWMMPCEECSKVKVHAHPVPNNGNTKATKRLGCVEMYFMEPMKHPTVGGRHCVMIFVDAFTSISWIHTSRNKRDKTAGLKCFVFDVAAPVKLQINVVITEEQEEFEEVLQKIIDELSTKGEVTPPGTPPYNEQVKIRLEVLKKTMGLIEGVLIEQSDI